MNIPTTIVLAMAKGALIKWGWYVLIWAAFIGFIVLEAVYV